MLRVMDIFQNILFERSTFQIYFTSNKSQVVISYANWDIIFDWDIIKIQHISIFSAVSKHLVKCIFKFRNVSSMSHLQEYYNTFIFAISYGGNYKWFHARRSKFNPF